MIKFCEIQNVEPILKNPKKELSEENPTKAYKLTIYDGQKQLTVVSAIVDLFKPESLLNQVVTFDFNYPPMEIRGFISEAMIYLTSDNKLIASDLDFIVGATYDAATQNITINN